MALPSPQTNNESQKNSFTVHSQMLETPKYPWRRFLARKIDEIIFILLSAPVSVFIGLILCMVYNAMTGSSTIEPVLENLLVVQLFVCNFVQFIILESLLLRFWGTTPGKRLFGLKVRVAEGRKLSFLEALKRSGCLYGLFWTVALIIPLVGIIIYCFQYRKLMKSGYTTWDQGARITVGRY